ncbi:hypothetical protein [Enterobacter roggenkampii]|uniref:hypothetical protein n=1 Tax=Enterobacter roggenkampii TaxID=1812935 RepID=UPI002DB72789|nr:hypothetical protein [Enterobacter roggenkampii]MEB5890013.1 hypothetical protein [Enterobacter roggenkampii]
MNRSKIKKIILKIDDPKISGLPEIAKLSYSAFLKRVGEKIHLRWAYYIYQHAIHSTEEARNRAQVLRKNPQLKNIKSLYNKPSSSNE